MRHTYVVILFFTKFKLVSWLFNQNVTLNYGNNNSKYSDPILQQKLDIAKTNY